MPKIRALSLVLVLHGRDKLRFMPGESAIKKTKLAEKENDYHMIALVCGIEKEMIQMNFICKAETDL